MAASVELLKAARAKIADPKHWTRYRLARNARGNEVRPTNKRAVCWCAHGALRAVGIPLYAPEEILLFEAAGELFKLEPYAVNDQRGHAAILGVYDLAIAKAEASNA